MADERDTVATKRTWEGRARYTRGVDGNWSVFHLEFDPPMVLPAHHSARYKTPLPPRDDDPAVAGPWFPLTVTFEANHVQ